MRCPRCNSENPPEYRFCGMCGTPLDKPAESPLRSAEPASERVRRAEPAPESLSGPSFLGLSGPSRDSADDVTYLFEEDQPKRTYWRFLLLLAILGIVGALGWLEYKRSGKAWVAPWAHQQASAPADTGQQPANGPKPPENSPSQPAAAANLPANAPSAATQNQPANPSPPKETDLAPATTPANPASSGPAAEKAAPPATQQPAPASETAKKDVEATPETGKSDENEASSDEADTREEQPVTKPKAARAKPTAPPSTNPDDALVANAEKYLYGRGVPENCDRALVALRAAADRQNARAQTLLGTMYGTGHCVPRDLPNAYRWFALASRQQSDNMWIQRNLEMIWREMTPQERQLAMQANR